MSKSDDLINRQAAIEALQNHYEVRNPIQNAIMDECVVLISNVPSVQPEPCEDAVSRANLRLMKTEECEGHTIEYAMGWKACIEWIKTLPSAQPERKTGKWIRENIVLTSNPPQYQWHCSECGRLVHWFSAEILTDFCPNCGSDNRGDKDEQKRTNDLSVQSTRREN